jgi:hypothetical protein
MLHENMLQRKEDKILFSGRIKKTSVYLENSEVVIRIQKFEVIWKHMY